MKFRLIQKEVAAVQWKGWPHKIKGLEVHPSYGQLAIASFHNDEIYPGDWIITHADGYRHVMNHFAFEQAYARIKK